MTQTSSGMLKFTPKQYKCNRWMNFHWIWMDVSRNLIFRVKSMVLIVLEEI